VPYYALTWVSETVGRPLCGDSCSGCDCLDTAPQDEDGCGCTADGGGAAATWLMLLGLGALRMRRRRSTT